MDVTSLLNVGARPSLCKQSIEDSTSIPEEAKPMSSLTTLPRPSPERTFDKDREIRNGRGRKPWNAGGYALPRCMESKPPSRSLFSAPSHEQEHGSSHKTPSRIRSQSLQSSTDSSIDPESPKHSAPLAGRARVTASVDRSDSQMEPTRTVYQDERGSYSREPSIPPRHRVSDSGSSLSSYGSSQSGYHSRLSSVTSVSGASSYSLSVTELPLVESKLAECGESSPILGREEVQSPTSLPEEKTAITPDDSDKARRPRSPSDAVLNLKGLTKSLLATRSSFQPPLRPNRPFSSRPKFHKRAISAPDFAPRSAYASSNTLRHWYPVLPPPLEVMDVTRGGQTPNEEDGHRSNMITTTHSQLAHQERRESAPQQATGFETGIGQSPTPECNSRRDSVSPAVAGDPTSQLAQGIFQTPSSTLLEDPASAFPEPLEKEPCCMFVKDCNTGSQLRKAISHIFGRNKACTLRIPKEVWVYYCRKHYQRIRYRNAKTYPLNQMELVRMQIHRLRAWSDTNQRKGDGPYIKVWTLSLRKREQNRLEKGAAEDGDDDPQAVQGGSGAPEWIIERLGTGYSTAQILDVVNRLYEEIRQGTLSLVPEIEFLPDITDPEEGGSSKPVRLRKHNRTTSESKAPKRKASDATNVFGGVGPSWREDDDELVSPLEKRPRLDSTPGHYRQPSSHLPAPPAAMPSYMEVHHVSPATGLHAAPPRALPVVPRMQPLEYAQNASIHGHRPSSHIRAESFNNAFGQGQQASTYYPFNADSVQPPAHQWNKEYNGRPRLPSISAQVPEDHDFQAAPSTRPYYGSRAINSSGHGYHCAGHQRSVSAFTLSSQPGLVYTRPSSSGNGTQPGLPHLDSRAAGSSDYDAGAQGFSRDPWAEQEYNYAQGWGHPYAPGFASQQQPYQHTPMYEPTLRHRVDNPRAPPAFATARPPVAPERAEPGSHAAGAWRRVEQSTDESAGEAREN